jgi:hypothetical protein
VPHHEHYPDGERKADRLRVTDEEEEHERNEEEEQDPGGLETEERGAGDGHGGKGSIGGRNLHPPFPYTIGNTALLRPVVCAGGRPLLVFSSFAC